MPNVCDHRPLSALVCLLSRNWVSKKKRRANICMTFFTGFFTTPATTRVSLRELKDLADSRHSKLTLPFSDPNNSKHPHTLHKVIHTLQANKKQLTTHPRLLTVFRLRDKHNAKRCCSFMHQFKLKHLLHWALRALLWIHSADNLNLFFFLYYNKWNWKLLPCLAGYIWIRDTRCDTPARHTWNTETRPNTHSCAETCTTKTTDFAALHSQEAETKSTKCMSPGALAYTYRHDSHAVPLPNTLCRVKSEALVKIT